MLKKQKKEKKTHTIDTMQEILEVICPLGMQENWDNCGYQLKISNKIVSKVLIALEINDSVIEEAISENVQLIVTHHPLLFSPVKKITTDNPFGIYIQKLMKHEMSVYSMHTNFDAMNGGNNDYFGQLMGFEDVRLVDANIGVCRKTIMEEPIPLRRLAERLAVRLDIEPKSISIVGNLDKVVSKVAWCTGAGADFIKKASSDDLEVFITGDVKYHVAQEAKEMGMSVIDVGHYGSEKIFVDNACEILDKKFQEMEIEDIEIIRTKINIDPFVHL